MTYPDLASDSTNTGNFRLGKVVVVFLTASICLLNGDTGTGTALSKTNPAALRNYRLDEVGTTSNESYYIQSHESSSRSLFEFRRISGFTWDKIAEIFAVTRRSVHFWANGKPMEDFRAEKLDRLLEIIRKLDTGFALQNRRLLFAEDKSGVSLFDLFKRNEFSSAELLISSFVKPRSSYTFKPLSEKGLEEVGFYPPVSPFDLLEADNRYITKKTTKVSVANVRKVNRKPQPL